MISRKSTKRLIRRWAYDRGYIVEPRRHVTLIALAERLRQIFADYTIETVIDVGANEGQYGAFLRERVGFAGRIESFEPIPSVVQKLRKRTAVDDKWTVHERALGAEAGHRTLNVAALTVFSSFHPIAQEHRATIPVAESINVAMTTLDAEIFGKVDLRHTYLKLDTQGFDLEVLKGAPRSIAHIPALQTEVSFQPFYRNMPSYRDSLDAFGRHGFVVADFFLAAADGNRVAMEFDCLMVRPPGRAPNHPERTNH